MGSGDGSPYVKREWDAESGAWVPTADYVPDPSATVPGKYVSDELFERISTGSFTREDVENFESQDDTTGRKHFDFPDWASGGTIPARKKTPVATKRKRKPDPAMRTIILGSVGGLVAGVLVASGAILLVAVVLVLLT